MNKRLCDLRNAAEDIEGNPTKAVAAMIELAQYYQRPGEDQNYELAYDYAAAAAAQDSPDGYLEVTRVLGLGCIAADDSNLKIEFANAAVDACDFETVLGFGRPDIAYNVGIICEYMGEENIEGLGTHYLDIAKSYYSCAAELARPTKPHADPKLLGKAQAAKDRYVEKIQRQRSDGVYSSPPMERYIFQ